jgi:adenylate cyclase
MSLVAYLPQDRRAALARGVDPPERTSGVALFADIAGFTPLTEALDRALGARRGVEAMTEQINRVYDALIAEVEHFGGSVIGFAGDSMTCWFNDGGWGTSAAQGGVTDRSWGPIPSDGSLIPNSQLPTPAAPRAVACALALQQAMRAFAAIPLPGGTTTTLALKVAVASGSARRLAVGDPNVQLLDVLAGAPLTRAAIGEHLTRPGEVLLDEVTAAALDNAIQIAEWRADAESGERFAVLRTTDDRRPTIDDRALRWPVVGRPSSAQLRPWLLPAVYERHQAGLGDFLTELRPVVALFLRFGGIDYDADPDAGVKLDMFIRRVQQIVARYDGTLLQLTIGDKGSYLYAGFGAPAAHENDARRAAHTALACLALHGELEFVQPLQIGLSQGVLRVGAFGSATRRTYGAMGDDVNLAARLMSLAAPGEALVSARVHAALAAEPGMSRVEGFALEPLAPISLKGMPEPLPIFRLANRRERAVRLTEPAYALPMVGRQAELALIGERLELALVGQGQLVGITAEAGMGKSRLLAEAIRLARRKGLRGFGGACQSYGTNTPYLVWGPIWRAFFGLDPELPARRQIRALEGLIADWAPDRIAALPLLGQLLNVPLQENDFTRTLEPQFRKSALHALLLDCLTAAAREAQAEGSGLLLVLEDLHWIDALSHELLEEIGRATQDLPILLLLAYRPPELLRLQTPRVESLLHFTRVELAPLTDAEAEQAIRAKLAQLLPERKGAATPTLIARIMAKAQGNPFYAEELLNYLRDRGIDTHDTAAIERLDLPSSLHTLILSRIDQLSARQQATLKLASVIGRLFRFAHLHGAYPILGAPEPLRADLDELARLELTPLDTPEPELAYLFKHIVTQEVAYESLTAQARASLHEQLAAYMEQQAGDDIERYLDLLAYHYERSENLTKKREYLRRAGEAAAARYANDAAVDYLSRALDVTPIGDLAERWALLWARVRVLHLMGARTAEVQDLDALESLAEAFNDDMRRAEVGIQHARYAEAIAMYSEGAAIAARALKLAQAAGATATAAAAGQALGAALLRHGRFEQADVELAQAFVLAEQASLAEVAAECLSGRGVNAWARGDYQLAHDLEIQAYERYRAIGHRRGQGTAFGNLGEHARMYGDYASARTYYEQSIPILDDIGDRRYACMCHGNLALVANMQGAYAAARASAEQGLRLAREAGERFGEGSLMGVFGEALLGLGQLTEAVAAYQSAVDTLRELGLPHMATEPLAGLARVALTEGNPAQALMYVEEILAYVNSGGTLHGTNEPLRVYLTCYHVLQAIRDSRAAGVLETAYATLQEQASKIGDEALRRSFLENVPYHHNIVAAWAEMHGGA